MTSNDTPTEELGVRALPPDATPAQRAHAEAVWRPATADQPCRCCGTDCEHGQPCREYDDCDGRYIHTGRYPGSMLELSAWWDEYTCDGAATATTAACRFPRSPGASTSPSTAAQPPPPTRACATPASPKRATTPRTRPRRAMSAWSTGTGCAWTPTSATTRKTTTTPTTS